MSVRALVVALTPLASVACVHDDCTSNPVEFLDSGYPPGSTGLHVKFAIDPKVADNLDGEPRGPFVGQVFEAADVGSMGPSRDAVALGTITIDDLDLSPSGDASDVLFSITPVQARPVTILGFVDTDDNADPDDPQPDRGDPVTLPGDNEFEMVSGHQNVVTVFFGLLNPL